FLGEKLRGEPLPFANALDLDCRRFDDLLDAIDSGGELRIFGGRQRFALTAALSEEIGAHERSGENGYARKHSNERNDGSQISRHSMFLGGGAGQGRLHYAPSLARVPRSVPQS